MPVRGDEATWGVEVIDINGVTLTWNVQTRTRESTTTEKLFTTDQTKSAVGMSIAKATDQNVPAKELVRYMFKTGGTASITDYVHLRALQPSFEADR